MHRPWLSRLTATILAIWLALVSGESGLLHACEMHDVPHVVSVGKLHIVHQRVCQPRHFPRVEAGKTEAHAAAPAASMAMGDEQSGGMSHHAPPSEHQGCTCVGCCFGGGTVAVVPTVPTSVFEVAFTATPRMEPVVGLLPRPVARYSRPFTTGPPRA